MFLKMLFFKPFSWSHDHAGKLLTDVLHGLVVKCRTFGLEDLGSSLTIKVYLLVLFVGVSLLGQDTLSIA